MIIYISCPVSIPIETFNEMVAQLTISYPQHKFTYWDRKKVYSHSLIYNADTVAFVLPDQEFKTFVANLPSGLLGELKRARYDSKNLAVIYRPKSNPDSGYLIYEAKVNSGNTSSPTIFGGVPGTTDRFSKRVFESDLKTDVKEVVERKIILDRRILLFA